jgi:hypothetical protein
MKIIETSHPPLFFVVFEQIGSHSWAAGWGEDVEVLTGTFKPSVITEENYSDNGNTVTASTTIVHGDTKLELGDWYLLKISPRGEHPDPPRLELHIYGGENTTVDVKDVEQFAS